MSRRARRVLRPRFLVEIATDSCLSPAAAPADLTAATSPSSGEHGLVRASVSLPSEGEKRTWPKLGGIRMKTYRPITAALAALFVVGLLGGTSPSYLAAATATTFSCLATSVKG